MSAIIHFPNIEGLLLRLLRDDDQRLAQLRPMCRMWAKKYFFRSRLGLTYSIDDLEAVCLVAAWRALGAFDKDSSMTLESFAYGRMGEALSRLNRKDRALKRQGTVMSMSTSGSARDGEESDPWEFPSQARSPEELAEVSLAAARLRPAVAQLNANQREFLAARFGEGSTFKEAGESLGVTRQRAEQLEIKALAKLRGLLDRDRLRRSSSRKDGRPE